MNATDPFASLEDSYTSTQDNTTTTTTTTTTTSLLISQIAQNWNLHPTQQHHNDIVPTALHPSHWDEPLLSAIHDLSTLTVGQKERADSLLNTYFHARIREASYTGKQGSIYATLEVEDVEKAIASVRKMRKGQEMQGGVETNLILEANTEVVEPTRGKRQYSIRRNSPCEGEEEEEPFKKLPRMMETGEEGEMTPVTCGSEDEFADRTPLPPLFRPLLPKPPRLRLPPIDTQAEPAPYSPSPCIPPPQMHFVQAAQRATHEFNVQRLELARAESGYNAALHRYVEAEKRMQDARREVGAWR